MSDLLNPLQSLISQASQLQDSGAAKKYQQRVFPSAKQKAGSSKILLLDISGSMGEYVSDYYGGRRKIEILQNAIAPIARHYEILAFSSDTQWIKCGILPEPCGGTAMHLALAVAAEVRPAQTLVVSDGHPDDEKAALATAKRLTGTISTLYIGSDSDNKAIEFMRKLARLGCGQADVMELSLGAGLLQEKVQKLLPYP